jgi:hypothetical protein
MYWISQNTGRQGILLSPGIRTAIHNCEQSIEPVLHKIHSCDAQLWNPTRHWTSEVKVGDQGSNVEIFAFNEIRLRQLEQIVRSSFGISTLYYDLMG